MPDVIDLADLARRLEVLEEERAILRTLYTYAHCIDYGRRDEFLDLFTDDTVRAVQSRDGHLSMELKGKQAVADSPAAGMHTHAPDRYHKHVMLNPLITFTAKDEATVESYSLRLDEINGDAVIYSFGRYHDKLVKQDGKWRFKERKSEVEHRHG